MYISENMPSPTAANNIPVLYGDFSGMAMKISQDLEIQLMREKYIDKNAVGIVGWAECDSKIQNNQMPFEYIVIDTINGVMVGDEMRKCKEKGYDKWMDLAQSIWDILDFANNMDDKYTVILTAHSETVNDDNGYTFTRIRTSGRKLSKIVLESKMTTVLWAKGSNGRFIFETKANNSTAKTPMGAFEDMEIDNDIVKVVEALKDY